MTVGKGDWWIEGLGDFRKEELRLLTSLPDKRVVVDTSSWVHKMDGIFEVAYARTCTPSPYPHTILQYSFAAKVRALKKLGITPLFVFDGKPTNVKMRENERRSKDSISSHQQYREKVDDIIQRLDAGGTVSIEERQELLTLRRKSARPTPEDYAFVCQWMVDNGIEYMQAPFEADGQMKALIGDGKASAAISEDGDLVIYEVPRILTKTKVDTKKPEKSKCQYFELDKLKGGDYNSPIANGDRSKYLPEISCFLGNDYIERLSGNGVATVFATGGRSNREAVIDSFIGKEVSERKQWLNELEKSNDSGPNKWTAELFISTSNLLRHYPVFRRNDFGVITLEPLNPLPEGVAHENWGEYIGFEKHPSEYFNNADEYREYYTMQRVGCTGQPRSEHLGPRYSAEENPDVDTNELLPIFTRIDFTKDPVDVQPTSVLKAYLLNHGIETTEGDSDDDIREWTKRAVIEKKKVLPPSMKLQPFKWVGFEPLDEVELGDDYDDWVSLSYVLSNDFYSIYLTTYSFILES